MATDFLNLTQYTDDMIVSFLTNYNTDMLNIDNGVKANNQKVLEFLALIETLTTRIVNVETLTTENKSAIELVKTSLETLTEKVNTLDSSYGTISSKVAQLETLVNQLVGLNIGTRLTTLEARSTIDFLNETFSGFVSDTSYADFPFQATKSFPYSNINKIVTASLKPNQDYKGLVLIEPLAQEIRVYVQEELTQLEFEWISLREVLENA